MIRINIVVEGHSEEQFVRDILGEDLAPKCIYVYARRVKIIGGRVKLIGTNLIRASFFFFVTNQNKFINSIFGFAKVTNLKPVSFFLPLIYTLKYLVRFSCFKKRLLERFIFLPSGRMFELKMNDNTMNTSKTTSDFNKLVISIQQIHTELSTQVSKAINVSLTLRNWLIGMYIHEYELFLNEPAGIVGWVTCFCCPPMNCRVGNVFLLPTILIKKFFRQKYSEAKLLPESLLPC
ncbi:MAG: hypothetical protein DRR16_11515 [Candidatus Parabeggiatoa sp. nov. 3]|nr:MAG: hypothetical protein DRR00_06590 [Gammaproteobacteria bacterium]RKZ66386.1 MAG: hypothetical protein DRQ99_09870 [Gammaproteobacteria bacterium]RKZ85673.1 MAG: hypothetical protein DRR16_11515 [Gammaproteobacteria bacterium]